MIFRRYKNTKTALQKTSNELEKIVAERTADIRKANEMLRKEIEERKRAQLETKNATMAAEAAVACQAL